MSTIQIYDGEKFVPFNISNAIEMPVGFEDYVSYTELDPGQLIRNGQLVSREIYSDLWNFVQSKPSMLLTEEEWQANLTANEGLACNYYSAGDGSTNFRLPKASVIVLPDPNPENINKYSTDTQRNITGLLAPRTITNQDRNLFINATSTWDTGYQSLSDMGAFRIKDISWSGSHLPMQSGSKDLSNYKTTAIDFDASRSVGVEHTGNEVKPKTITKLPIVYAFGRIVNAGELDFQTVVQKQNDLTLNHQIKSFTDLTQIGLTNGIEQFQDIGKNLPENSQITYRVWEKDNHNHVLYPSISGIFTMEKAITFCRCFYNSITPNKQWQMAFDYRDEFYIEPTWELLAKNNKLSMPSNNKIIINLKNQGDSWTAPCDGYIWGMKIGGSDVVNSWLNVWDSTDADTSNYGTLIYCDYGQPYINLCGNLAVRKGQTVYFNWNNNCRVYFYPALNNNMPVYGEDVRIYIQVVNSQGIVRGATVNISIGSEYTETGKTLTDGRYLLSYAGYNVLKTAESLNVEVTCEDGTTGQTQAPVGYFEDKINELQVLVS
nr:MAG TPA: hypothetical protein [Caudoviricetes sp.]